jgi:glycosyltransferase involved in cell wall biosynthesis
MKLSIIIPFYNEQDLIVQLLKEFEKVSWPLFLESYEIILVDDCSGDKSIENVSAFIREKPLIKLFQHQKNQGKGAAVRTGTSKASGDIILLQDADMELSPHDIPSMLTAMHTLQVPFVNGSRYLPGILRTQSSFQRYFFNKFFTLLTSIFINVHLTDMACGYKLISKELFEKLHLRENRFGFEAELIIKCARLQKNWITEVPVRYTPRNAGEGKKLKNSDGLRILKTILKYGLFRIN